MIESKHPVGLDFRLGLPALLVCLLLLHTVVVHARALLKKHYGPFKTDL